MPYHANSVSFERRWRARGRETENDVDLMSSIQIHASNYLCIHRLHAKRERERDNSLTRLSSSSSSSTSGHSLAYLKQYVYTSANVNCGCDYFSREGLLADRGERVLGNASPRLQSDSFSHHLDGNRWFSSADKPSFNVSLASLAWVRSRPRRRRRRPLFRAETVLLQAFIASHDVQMILGVREAVF